MIPLIVIAILLAVLGTAGHFWAEARERRQLQRWRDIETTWPRFQPAPAPVRDGVSPYRVRSHVPDSPVRGKPRPVPIPPPLTERQRRLRAILGDPPPGYQATRSDPDDALLPLLLSTPEPVEPAQRDHSSCHSSSDSSCSSSSGSSCGGGGGGD